MKMATPNMLENSVVAERERREMAVLAAAEHIQRHGLALLDIVEAVCDRQVADTVIELIAQSSELLPNADAVEARLEQVATGLANAAFSDLLVVVWSGRCHTDVEAAIRWHGSRLADHVTRLKRSALYKSSATGGAKPHSCLIE